MLYRGEKRKRWLYYFYLRSYAIAKRINVSQETAGRRQFCAPSNLLFSLTSAN